MTRALLPSIALLAIAIVWGVTFTVTKETLQDIEPESFMFWRFLAASVLLLIPALFRRELSVSVVRGGGLLGALVFLGYWTQTRGLLYTTPSKSAFLTGLAVVLVPFLDRAVFKQRVSARATTGAIVATAGTTILVGDVATGLGLGEALTLICAVCFALHMIVAAKVSRRFPPFGLAAVQIAIVAIASFPLIAFNPAPRWSREVVLVVLGTAVVNTAAAFCILMWAQARVTATQAAIILAFEPVAAALSSTFYYRELVTWQLLSGGGLIIVAMIMSQLPDSRTRTENQT